MSPGSSCWLTQAHLDYIESIRDRVLVAGPMLCDPDVPDKRGEFDGSLFVYATNDRDEARGLLEQDPYYRAGIYAQVSWARFTPARGSWL